MDASGRSAVAAKYLDRADNIVEELRKNCATDYSQHCQIWAVLSGAVNVREAQVLLRKSIEKTRAGIFVQESVSMTFYTLRALSVAGLYDEQFHHFRGPGVNNYDSASPHGRKICLTSVQTAMHGGARQYTSSFEVVGIRPVDGWTALEFKPRVTLYRDYEAKVPLKMVKGKPIGICYVPWATLPSGDIEVRLRMHMDKPHDIEIRVRLPGQKIQLTSQSHDLSFIVTDACNWSLGLDKPKPTNMSLI